MRLKSLVIAVCSLGLLTSVGIAQEQAPPDKASQTRMSVPTGGKMRMKHSRHHRMMHKKHRGMMHKKMM